MYAQEKGGQCSQQMMPVVVTLQRYTGDLHEAAQAESSMHGHGHGRLLSDVSEPTVHSRKVFVFLVVEAIVDRHLLVRSASSTTVPDTCPGTGSFWAFEGFGLDPWVSDLQIAESGQTRPEGLKA